jgi:ABC-type uncharacterized transport system permease subunit
MKKLWRKLTKSDKVGLIAMVGILVTGIACNFFAKHSTGAEVAGLLMCVFFGVFFAAYFLLPSPEKETKKPTPNK